MAEPPAEVLFPGELPRGSLVAGYKVRQRVGVGPTGAVYAAVHPQSGHKVAVKLLHPHLDQRPDLLRRFEEVSQRLAALRHPGVIPHLEMGRLADGQVYLIAEFALGQPLADLLASSGPLEPRAARPLLEALSLVLATAHGHDIVHGDLTPDNIWVTPSESGEWPPMVRVMDFGMGLLRGGEEGRPRWLEETPYYLSPEQCRGESPQPSSDIYALGVIAYQVLTGRLPFSSSMPAEVVRMHLNETPRLPSSLVPLERGVDDLLLRALAKTPAERFQTMLQFRQALRGDGSEPVPAQAPTLEAGPAQAATDAPAEDAPTGPPAAAGQPVEVITLDAEPPPAASPGRQAMAPPLPVAAPERGRRLTGPEGPASSAGPAAYERERNTAVLPILPDRRLGRWLSAGLGLLMAGAAVLVGFQIFFGHLPWEGSGKLPEGQLLVVSQPAGARVFLNQVAQPGRTPLTITGLLRGQPYELAVLLPGHEPFRQTVALGLEEDERRLSVRLDPGPTRFGSLTLTSTEPADFFLDDRKVATRARQATLADVQAGVEHELRVVAPGFKLVQQKVLVEAGKSQVLHFPLERASDGAGR